MKPTEEQIKAIKEGRDLLKKRADVPMRSVSEREADRHNVRQIDQFLRFCGVGDGE